MKKKIVDSLRKRHKTLSDQAENWIPIWRLIYDHFFPLKSKYTEKDYDPTKVTINNTMVDDISIRALRVLAAGLHGGMTSPSRPWFKLGLPIKNFEPSQATKVWLEKAEDIILNMLARSNFYEAIHRVYFQLGAPGTAAIFGTRDPKTKIRFNTLTIGQYVISQNATGRVDTIFRYIDMTAAQIVEQFGEENCSREILSASQNDSTRDNFFKVIHCVTPNQYYVEDALGYLGKKYLSIYWEEKSKERPCLSIGGYDIVPFAAPRWEVEGNEVYGISPGLDTINNVKQLQSISRTMLKAMHKEVDPPMNADKSLKHASLAPGAINFVGTKDGFTPTIQTRSNPDKAMIPMDRVETAIKEGMYNDLFLMLNMTGGDRMTIREVQERTEEKMLMLGPVVTRLINELLDWVIDWTFNEAIQQELIPEPPEEIQGVELKVNYVSMLAQAQKMVGRIPVEQYMQFIATYGEIYPEIADALDVDAAVDAFATFADTPATMVRPKEVRDEMRKARAEAQQAQMQAQQDQMTADTLQKTAKAEQLSRQ